MVLYKNRKEKQIFYIEVIFMGIHRLRRCSSKTNYFGLLLIIIDFLIFYVFSSVSLLISLDFLRLAWILWIFHGLPWNFIISNVFHGFSIGSHRFLWVCLDWFSAISMDPHMDFHRKSIDFLRISWIHHDFSWIFIALFFVFPWIFMKFIHGPEAFCEGPTNFRWVTRDPAGNLTGAPVNYQIPSKLIGSLVKKQWAKKLISSLVTYQWIS